jgi:hypothetical protein
MKLPTDISSLVKGYGLTRQQQALVGPRDQSSAAQLSANRAGTLPDYSKSEFQVALNTAAAGPSRTAQLVQQARMDEAVKEQRLVQEEVRAQAGTGIPSQLARANAGIPTHLVAQMIANDLPPANPTPPKNVPQENALAADTSDDQRPNVVTGQFDAVQLPDFSNRS